jgi:hypothetical protein
VFTRLKEDPKSSSLESSAYLRASVNNGTTINLDFSLAEHDEDEPLLKMKLQGKSDEALRVTVRSTVDDGQKYAGVLSKTWSTDYTSKQGAKAPFTMSSHADESAAGAALQDGAEQQVSR